MIFCYTQISALSGSIREASSCSRRERIQRPTANAERESLEHTALSGISIKSLPSELREPCRREGRNCVRDREVEDSRTRPTKSTEQSSDELTRSSMKIFYLSVPECVSKWVYNSCAFSWGSFPFVSLPCPTLM